MPKAQCYYEILGISELATGDEVKKAYRNLALVWHPDKNPSNPEAHAKFQTILKAYETLSDNREREWYDRHKDQILSEGNEEKSDDDHLLGKNLFQYFSSSCYANFDDLEDGFYTVYRKLFEEIAQEETHAYQLASRLAASKNSKQARNKKDEAPEFPTFGDSGSDYEDIVRPFYAYWSGFRTNVTFDHLDKYNTLEAENRRILRLMEKENKKLKEQARKERNTNIRNLVEFIKKRDRRLKAHKILVEEQNELNRQKTAEKQRQQRERLAKESAKYKPNAWDEMNDIEEQLRQLENEYDLMENSRKGNRNRAQANESSEDEDDDDVEPDEQPAYSANECDNENESGEHNEISNRQNGADDDDDDVEEEEDDEEEEPDLFCPACNKEFKSVNAYENHENSKKHKQNVAKLTKLLQQEENKLNK